MFVGLATLTIGIGLWHELPHSRRSVLGDGQPALTTMVLPNAPGGVLTVEIADESEERMNGLSRRDGLEPGRGMLFLFPQAAVHAFWMKEMRFPLDIIYLRDGVVVQVFAQVPAPLPGEEPRTVEPRGPIDAVLELPAGEAARRGISEGVYFQGLPSLR